MLKAKFNWPVNNRLDQLSEKLKALYEQEYPLSEILDKKLVTEYEHVLDSVISCWKINTESYTKELRAQRIDKLAQINKKKLRN